MASLIKKPNSKYWFACFRDVNGRQCRRSTGETNEKKARAVAQAAESIAQKRFRPRRARQMLSELFRETYGQDLPTATISQFATDWLSTKKRETAPATLASYSKALAKF